MFSFWPVYCYKLIAYICTYMRKILLSVAIGIMALSAAGQDKKTDKVTSDEAPYLKHKELPAIEILDINGKDTFNTYNIKEGRPTLIIYFSPDCDHCKIMLDAIEPEIDKLKDIDIYMVTFMPPIALQVYNSVHHWEKHSNVKLMGQDIRLFFPGFYGVTSVPDVVLYDKKKKFVKLWPGGVSIREILEANK